MPPAKKREETPDVLGKLLGGQKPAAPPEEEKAAEPAEQEEEETPPEERPTSKPAKQQARKPARQRAKRTLELPVSDEKVKATYYLSPEMLDSLESAWLQLRRMAGQDKRGQVSKSLIVEASLLVALEELKAKAEQSQLASILARQ